MIEKPAEIINAYLTDSQNKEIVIEHEGKDYDSINYYTGNMEDELYGWSNTMTAMQMDVILSSTCPPLAYDDDFKQYIHEPINDDWSFYIICVDFMLISMPATMSLSENSFTLGGIFYYDESNPSLKLDLRGTYSAASINIYNRNTFKLTIHKSSPYINQIMNAWKVEWHMGVFHPGTVHGGETVVWSVGAPRVFFSTTTYIDISWTPAPNFGDLDKTDFKYTIDNDELLLQDFTLTESLCSQDNIKFGLCEAAHCEFNCVTTDNPKAGDKITITSKLPGSSALTDAQLTRINWSLREPVGGFSYTYSNFDPFFEVYICPSDMADWSKYVNSLSLKSRKLYVKFEMRLTFSNVSGTTPTYFKVIEEVDYSGTPTDIVESSYRNVNDHLLVFDTVLEEHDINGGNGRILRSYDRVRLKFYDANKDPFTFGDTHCTYVVETRNWQFGVFKNETLPAFDRSDMRAANGTLDEYIYAHNNAIPLGVFFIDSVSKKYRHNLVEKSVTAYDKLVTLEQNAADWYTSYMFGVNMDGWTSNGFEYARQIFSSYFNYVMSIGLESKDRYIENVLSQYNSAEIYTNHLSSKYLTYSTSNLAGRIRYAQFVVSDPDPTKMYMVKCTNANGWTDEQILDQFPGTVYFQNVDALGRGIVTNGGVLVWETRDNGTTAGFCVNRGDYFMISPNCTSFTIYVAGQTLGYDYSVVNYYLNDVTIYEVDTAPRLINGYLRLCYYNYGTKEIFACDSSITGRDVVRSLLEVCGCFFRLNRFNGLPEFVYPTKGGLYPSNTLFPADDLYPRSGTDGVYPMGRYMSIIAENYKVKDYGRIQILKDSKSNDTVSVCEWQYEGNPDAENTYIIDDNIFYCADDMLYDYDNMPEVAQMLAGMWNVISNLGYTPNITEALGSPWIECGDRMGLLTYDGGIETFVFRRTLKGIQNLKDTYESVGDELNEAIDTFGY